MSDIIIIALVVAMAVASLGLTIIATSKNERG